MNINQKIEAIQTRYKHKQAQLQEEMRAEIEAALAKHYAPTPKQDEREAERLDVATDLFIFEYNSPYPNPGILDVLEHLYRRYGKREVDTSLRRKGCEIPPNVSPSPVSPREFLKKFWGL